MSLQNKLTALTHSFVEAAILHGEGTACGDHKKTNSAYKKLIHALSALHEGDHGLAALRPMLGHENDSVRLFVATEFLFIDEDAAVGVLKTLAGGKGLTSFDAEMTLTEHRAGRLKPLHESQIRYSLPRID